MDYLVEEIPKAIEQSLEGADRVAAIVGAMKKFSHPGQEGKTKAISKRRAAHKRTRNSICLPFPAEDTGPAGPITSDYFKTSLCITGSGPSLRIGTGSTGISMARRLAETNVRDAALVGNPENFLDPLA
jgi:hypothetical protein